MISSWDQRCTTMAPAEKETSVNGKGSQLTPNSTGAAASLAVVISLCNSSCDTDRQDAVFCYWSQSWKGTWSCPLDGNAEAQPRSQTTLKVPCVDNQDHSISHTYLPHSFIVGRVFFRCEFAYSWSLWVHTHVIRVVSCSFWNMDIWLYVLDISPSLLHHSHSTEAQGVLFIDLIRAPFSPLSYQDIKNTVKNQRGLEL